MLCPYCGTKLQKGVAVCEKCGAALHASPSVGQVMDQNFGEFPDYYQADTDELGYLPECQQPMDHVPITVPKRPSSLNGERRKKPSLALRIPLQIFSFLLSIVLFVCVLATALLMDCNRILSAAGIKLVMDAVFSVSQSRPTVGVMPGAVGAGVRLDVNADARVPGNVELPADVLASGDTEALVDWLCDMAGEMAGQEIQLDRRQVQQFVEQSTLTDYVAEKAAGYAADFINGTRETLITTEELMGLLEENQALIEGTFHVEFTEDMKKQLHSAISTTIEENNLNEMIHEQMFTAMEETLDASLPIEWAKLQAILQILTSNDLMMGAITVCVLIMLLLCVLNFYNVPAGMTWSAVPCILVGGLLALPVALLQTSPVLLTDLLEIPNGIVQLIVSFLSAFALVHYGVLIFGVGLLALSILWRIIRALTY